jgi:Na+-transporting NADH:ubiquinone oxidoreductase subunit C
VAENKSNDSIGKTLLVVLVLCLVCSIVVAGSAGAKIAPAGAARSR